MKKILSTLAITCVYGMVLVLVFFCTEEVLERSAVMLTDMDRVYASLLIAFFMSTIGLACFLFEGESNRGDMALKKSAERNFRP